MSSTGSAALNNNNLSHLNYVRGTSILRKKKTYTIGVLAKTPIMYTMVFLAQVVSSTDKQIMQRAIYKDILTLFPAEYKRGVFLRELARINTFGFAQLFLKKQKFFKRMLPKYSGEFKEVYKMCWSQVGLFDKFKALFR